MAETPAHPAHRILVVDDESSMQRLLASILGDEGYAVDTAGDGRAALELHIRAPYDLIIQDLKMPGMGGLELLRELKARDPEALCVVVTAFSTWANAVEAMRLGAYDYIKKPFDTDNIRAVVRRALERRDLYRRTERPAPLSAARIVGSSPRVQAIFDMVRRVAATDTTVFIQGESGTGKELIARALHAASLRAVGPFVPVNCGAFTESLLESELFGHMKGSFTGAVADKKGLFELADGGTLFLDEVGEMSPAMQVKFLRVLESREFRPVGGVRDVKTDVRFVTATNRDVDDMVTSGAFREDLFYRLDVIHIALPPLRERREDIPLLAGHFLARAAEKLHRKVTSIDQRCMDVLAAYAWPGNVRELENTMERAVAFCEGERITCAELPERLRAAVASGGIAPQPSLAVADMEADSEVAIPPGGMDLEKRLEAIERAHIVKALAMTGDNLTQAAELLGMTFRSIRYKVKKLGIK